jgi:hypothetical protein
MTLAWWPNIILLADFGYWQQSYDSVQLFMLCCFYFLISQEFSQGITGLVKNLVKESQKHNVLVKRWSEGKIKKP